MIGLEGVRGREGERERRKNEFKRNMPHVRSFVNFKNKNKKEIDFKFNNQSNGNFYYFRLFCVFKLSLFVFVFISGEKIK